MAKGSYFQKHKEKIGIQHGGLPHESFRITDDTRARFEDGQVLLLDKPLHWTSFDVVRKIRNLLRIKKVGHAGTLDPLATGLLILCTGKYTKRINEYMAAEKEYIADITLGATTPTYDLESTPTDVKDFQSVTINQIHSTLATFTGEIEQVPPIYSAIKKNGVAAYELARRGDDVELKSRKITIQSIEIMACSLPVLTLKIACSTGTYIRSLAHDIGQQLGCGAYLSALRRTRIGEMNVEDGITPETFMNQLKKEAVDAADQNA